MEDGIDGRYGARKSYGQMIYEVVSASNKDVDWKLDRLAELYKIKPVRLIWYLAKAKLIFEKEKTGANVYPLLSGKPYEDLYSQENIAVWEFYKELDIFNKSMIMAENRCFFLAQMCGDKETIERITRQEKQREEELREDLANLLPIAQSYLIEQKYVNYHILRLYDQKMGRNKILKRPWIENIPNYGYLDECISNKKAVVIVADNSKQYKEALIMGRCIAGMGCLVFFLPPPETIVVDVSIPIIDTVCVSLDNATEEKGIQIIPVIELVLNGKSLGTNCAEIISRLSSDDLVLVMAGSKKFEELLKSEALRNCVDTLCGYQENFRRDYFVFGWAGSYTDYIGQLYHMDVKLVLERKPVCRFSIVIPARNSASTLRHTLKTCLNQRWQGEFEIVISDNSEEGNTEVYHFCQTLQNERIKYYRTPRDLRLNRSFEYAFLQTRGEYVLSIGSDDALLPWTLEVWDQVLQEYPDDEVFLWDRGFYAWPGFNGGQQHQFSIPGKYQKGKYNADYVEPIQYLGWAMEMPSAMYLLPMLYINSGFKRSFMFTLLKDTGRLWDGICQDIYMGVIVSVIKERVVKINYPLSIAGMSSSSVGAMSTLPVTDQARSESVIGRELKENNVGSFSRSQLETLVPENGSDVTSLYNSILRAVSRGLIPGHYLVDVFDWKKWFMNIYHGMNKADAYFDKKLQQMRFAAMKQGEEFLKWFDENILAEALEPVVFVQPERNARTYQEYDNDKGITVDASRYGVSNSFDASLLFENITQL